MRVTTLLSFTAPICANIIFEHAPLHCNITSPKIYHGCFHGQTCIDGQHKLNWSRCIPEPTIRYPTHFGDAPIYVRDGGFSVDGTCGPAHGNMICDLNSNVYKGGCCSQYGWCGNTEGHCGTGCISGCAPIPPPPTPSDSNTIPPRGDGLCGAKNGGATCDPKGPFGGCCSQFGFCGNTSSHCLISEGCQNGCTGSGHSFGQDEPILGPLGGGNGVGGETKDGTCGANNGNTVCGNWPKGNCCSAYGFCGNTDGHCGAGCQSGNCLGAPAVPVPGPSPAPANPNQGSFHVIGESGVPAMHAGLMSNGHVIFLDKLEDYSQLKLPNGRFAMSSEFDASNGKAIPLAYKTNAFCAGGTFLADGTMVSLGGNAPLDWLDDSIGDGFDAIRYIRRSSTDSNLNGQSWNEPGNKLASKRWYPTAQTLPDGTVFVASGSFNGLNPAMPSNNNPTYEVLNRDGTTRGVNYKMDILEKNQPYYMYPFVHLLKDGNLFVFVAKSAQLFNVPSNRVVRDLPGLPGDYRTYPNTGGSVLLPLSSRNGWEPEILICGGGAYQDITSPTDASCGRIAPLVPGSNWEMDSMPEGRGMVEGILLADGTVLWINGGNRGAQGFELMEKPTQQALLYDPTKPKGQRWTTVGTSPIPRLYHSVALLMPDATVLIAGSNPVQMPKLKPDAQDPYPTEFRVEIFIPPYLGGSQKYRANKVRLTSLTIKADGSMFRITFYKFGTIEKLKVMLHHNGFVTHSLHMGHRIVELDIIGGFPQPGPTGGDVTVLVAGPPTNNIAPPGPYYIYVIADGMPAEAVPVIVQ
ncbi:glyoxal oxidase N-terminus-domain-containing protein [Bisporella sp. PMI_857]|nr:glyoxal oxidase N-terminus-domain-containing protein [Bisporella sp. PMI_857]